jgi:hypothetical protein
MMIVAGDPPDFRTISEFRRRNLRAVAALFVQVLKLAEKAGLVKLGHVALDGTKIKANASKHKAMSYERMKKRETAGLKAPKLPMHRRIGSTAISAAMRCPSGWPTSRSGSRRSREAKAALEAEAKAAAEEEMRRRAQAEEKRIAEGRKKTGKLPAPPNTEPDGKAQRNFTDPESRILKTKDGYIQGYNAQAAVDATAQIIVAHSLDNNGSDQAQFAPLLDAIKANLKRNPDEVSADAGYCSAANLRTLGRRRIRGYIATGRQRHGAKSATAGRPLKPGSLLARMSAKLRRAGHRSRYRLRKQVVEPVFGQIKEII